MDNPADNLVGAKASLHVTLSLIGSRCFAHAAELASDGAGPGWESRLKLIAHELALAAEELGHQMGDLKRERVEKREADRACRKLRRIQRAQDRAGPKGKDQGEGRGLTRGPMQRSNQR